jgi:hypothetical protein
MAIGSNPLSSTRKSTCPGMIRIACLKEDRCLFAVTEKSFTYQPAPMSSASQVIVHRLTEPSLRAHIPIGRVDRRGYLPRHAIPHDLPVNNANRDNAAGGRCQKYIRSGAQLFG